jgi:VWFA-related protein
MRQRLKGTAAALLAAGLGAGAAPAPAVAPPESAQSELILIEVWAHTADGRPVADLDAADLELYVDGVRRPIAGLDPALARAGSPAGEPTPAEPERWERRYLLFFNDGLSAPEHMTAARRSALAFLAGAGRAGDRFAVASYEEHRRLRILLDFTADREAVRAAVRRSLADALRPSDLMLELNDEPQTGAGASRKESEAQAASVRRTLMDQVRSSGRGVHGGLGALVDSLAPYPGHKAIVYFGDGLLGVPQVDMMDLARAAIGAGVTFDVADTMGGVEGMGGVNPHTVLEALASETGGLSSGLSNTTDRFLSDVEKQPESGYIVSFVPPGPADGASHRVWITCRRAGVTLRHRPEYLRRTPEESRQHALQAAFIAPAMRQAFGLDLVVPAEPPPERSGVPVDLIGYVPAGRILFLPGPAGARADFELGLVALDDKGSDLARWSRAVTMTLSTAEAAVAREQALDLRLIGALPAGARSATLVVADRQSGEIGASRWSHPARQSGPQPGPVLLADLAERALWFDLSIAPGEGQAAPHATGLGAAVRSRFGTDGKPGCRLRLPAHGPISAGLRLVVRGADGVLLVQAVEPEDAVGGVGVDGIGLVPLRTESLGSGDFELLVEAPGPEGPVELGRTSFSLSRP